MVSLFLSSTAEHKEISNVWQALGFTELLRKLICFGFYLPGAEQWSQSDTVTVTQIIACWRGMDTCLEFIHALVNYELN